MQVLARALEFPLRTEIRDVDNERVSLPPAARIAVPEADVGCSVLAAVHGHHANKPLSLSRIVINAHLSRRLHDLIDGAEIRKKPGETTLGQRAVLGAVGAIHAFDVVDRRRLGMSWRRRPGLPPDDPWRRACRYSLTASILFLASGV